MLLPVLATLHGCSYTRVDIKLGELRHTIEHRDSYLNEFRERVDVLKEALKLAPDDSARGRIEYRLFQEFQYYDTDSAKIYASALMSHEPEMFPKDVLQAWHYAVTGEASLLRSTFESFDPSRVPAEFRSDCYSILASSYLLIFQSDRLLCDFMTAAVSDTAIKPDLKEMFIGTMYRSEKKFSEAAGHFMTAYESDGSLHMNMKARNAHLLAHAYRELGRLDDYEYWLAQSAIHDLQTPVKAYAALHDLSMVELSRGHVRHASEFVELFVKDALESKLLVRINRAVEYEQAIISVSERRSKRSIAGLSISVLLLLALLVGMFILWRRNNRLNKALIISDREKEEYIHRYIKLSLDYLGSVEKYRHKLRLLLKQEGSDAVLAQLRGPSQSESQYSNFYKEFDKTFLGIYPDFVSEVNALLKPEARFPDEHSLNLPLRVLAAIRLGITESREIATFLHCAPSSVYTYRSKLKADALSDKDQFEDKICRIS